MPTLDLTPDTLDITLQRGLALPLHATFVARNSAGATTGPLPLDQVILRFFVFGQIEDVDLLDQAAIGAAVLHKSTEDGTIVITDAPNGLADILLVEADTTDEIAFPQGLGQPWDLRVLQPALGLEYRVLAGTFVVE